ncbi:ATP synthase subunit I [Aurantivibrio plasticivorans]
MRPPILLRLLLLWLLLVAVAGTCLLFDTSLGLSLLWGGSASLLPSLCFAWYSYRAPWGARQAANALSAMYRAEAIKFLFTVAIFAAVFMQAKKVYPSVVFLTFVGAQLCAWVVTARAFYRRR